MSAGVVVVIRQVSNRLLGQVAGCSIRQVGVGTARSGQYCRQVRWPRVAGVYGGHCLARITSVVTVDTERWWSSGEQWHWSS